MAATYRTGSISVVSFFIAATNLSEGTACTQANNDLYLSGEYKQCQAGLLFNIGQSRIELL